MVFRARSYLVVFLCIFGILSTSFIGCHKQDSMPIEEVKTTVGKIMIGSTNLSEYQIVLPELPDEAELYAAEVLTSYIEKASGVTLTRNTQAEKAIYIGGYPDEALGEEGFDIRVVEGDLIISGNTPRGTLYGVYTFLEEIIGCRWYTPYCERVLPADEIIIPLDLKERQIPVFWMRDTNWFSMDVDYSFSTKHKLNANRNAKSVQDGMFGGLVEYTGRFVHTFEQLVPPERYMQEHPEYFSELKGQPCLTNPEVLKIAIASVRQILAINPDAKLISVSQNDLDYYCTCIECAKIDDIEGSHSGTLIRFVNAVAQDIAKDYPDVTIETLAYHYSRKPPQLTVPAKNVQIRLCPIECCCVHALEDDTCSQNQAFMEDFRGWSEICDNIAIWDYTVDYYEYGTFYPDFDTIFENASMYADRGVKNIFYEAAPRLTGEFGELRAYLLAKLAWNPYMSREEYDNHMNDFLEGYYGAGWESVRYFIDLAQKSAREKGIHFRCQQTEGISLGIGLEEITQVKENWALAMEKATPEQAKRLKLSYISVLLAEQVYYVNNQKDDPTYSGKAMALCSEIAQIAEEWELRRNSKGETWWDVKK